MPPLSPQHRLQLWPSKPMDKTSQIRWLHTPVVGEAAGLTKVVVIGVVAEAKTDKMLPKARTTVKHVKVGQANRGKAGGRAIQTIHRRMCAKCIGNLVDRLISAEIDSLVPGVTVSLLDQRQQLQ